MVQNISTGDWNLYPYPVNIALASQRFWDIIAVPNEPLRAHRLNIEHVLIPHVTNNIFEIDSIWRKCAFILKTLNAGIAHEWETLIWTPVLQ